MTDAVLQNPIQNLIDGEFRDAVGGETFEDRSPHDGRLVAEVARSRAADVAAAVAAAARAQAAWGTTPPVQRGAMLYRICNAMEQRQAEIAEIVALETGKSRAEALGETGGAIALGRFFAGEGQRLYGRTTTSGIANKYAMTIRQPCGVAGLIIAANTPIANTAWKVFPALVCGNAAVLKSAEDTPATSWLYSRIAQDAGLPPGVLNVIHGFGQECGAQLVEHPAVDVISFTGSTKVGREIARVAGPQMKKISLELGGKNPLVVCEDADIDNAVKWSCLSAFSNAGQRCAAGSRIIVFEAVYDAFRGKFVAAAKKLKVGPADGDDLGPVINGRQLGNMLAAIQRAKAAGATVIAGGTRLSGAAHAQGHYLAPTILENAEVDAEISTEEIFGPVVSLYRVADFASALRLANHTPYGLTAAIHTRNFDRAIEFSHKVKSGVAVINGGTYGSEPHMPFGGFGQSGNGSREPGTEALDVYSELKDIYMFVDPARL